MTKPPVAITFATYLIILTNSVVLTLTILVNVGLVFSKPTDALLLYIAYTSAIINLLLAAYLFKGQNWARCTYAITQSIGILLILGQPMLTHNTQILIPGSNAMQGVALNIVLFAITLYLLFIGKNAVFFTHKK